MSNNELIIIPKIEKYTKFKIYQPKERIINELDQYAKHKLKCKYYYRYMDDMVILCENKEKAQNILRSITVFLENNLKLTLKQLKDGKISLPEIQRSIAGWLGYVKHADSYNLRKSMFYIEG